MGSTPFAQLSSWIDPVEVLHVLIRLEADDATLKDRNTILLRSSLLQNGSEAGLRDMVTSYLNSFQVPYPIIALTKVYFDCSDISLRALSALAALRFDGTVTAYSRATVPAQLQPDTVLAIEGSDVLLDLIKYPCMALLDIVSESVRFYKDQRKVIESCSRVELVPSAPSRLQIEIEKVVAAHFGVHVAPEDHGLETPRLNQGYRSLTISGMPPIRELLLSATKEQSRILCAMAGSTPEEQSRILRDLRNSAFIRDLAN